MSNFLVPTKSEKPNRLDPAAYPNKDTNEQYHLDYGRWALYNAYSGSHEKWRLQTRINKRFYKNDQWFKTEDLEGFLQDDSGHQRSRIKVTNNLIRPMVEQYRGNAIRMRINATVQAISKMAINRREQKLAEKLFKTDVANEFPGVGGLMRANDKSIGETRGETKEIFTNLWVDTFVRDMNKLLRYVNELNEFEKMQPDAALNLGLSGLCVTEAYEHAGHQRYDIFDSEDFLFDHDARKRDLTDASYMGRERSMDPAEVFERWDGISEENRKAIEKSVSLNSSDNHINNHSSYGSASDSKTYNAGKVPVYIMYWRDIEKDVYGYVKDFAGYDYLARMGEPKKGVDGEFYQESDVIDPPDTSGNRKRFKKKNTAPLYADVLRFCSFIPGEAVVGSQQVSENKEGTFDIVLDFGKAPHQETEYQDLNNVKYPFKCYTWGYVDGEIFSPVDDAIDPQRFINRILSATEGIINTSGGSNIVVEKDAIPAQDYEAFHHNIKEGNPIELETRGKGITNAVGTYDATPGRSVYEMFNLIPLMKGLMQDTTGINEGLKGESTGPDQLVGVTELLIQRGSLMQEPFYDAMTQLFLQMFQHIATVGKRIYIDNERELVIAVGDAAAETIKLSKGMRNEDFRAFVQRENDEGALKNQANQLLTVFFIDLQIIDKQTFANLYDRSTPNEVTAALRESVGKQIENERRQAVQAKEEAQIQGEQEQQVVAAAEQEGKRQEAMARADKLNTQDHEMDKIGMKGLVDNAAKQAS
jgi:hypothetical protein